MLYLKTYIPLSDLPYRGSCWLLRFTFFWHIGMLAISEGRGGYLKNPEGLTFLLRVISVTRSVVRHNFFSYIRLKWTVGSFFFLSSVQHFPKIFSTYVKQVFPFCCSGRALAGPVALAVTNQGQEAFPSSMLGPSSWDLYPTTVASPQPPAPQLEGNTASSSRELSWGWAATKCVCAVAASPCSPSPLPPRWGASTSGSYPSLELVEVVPMLQLEEKWQWHRHSWQLHSPTYLSAWLQLLIQPEFCMWLTPVAGCSWYLRYCALSLHVRARS